MLDTLSVPLDLYLIKSVSGSVPSVATYPTTSAFTPDVPPVTSIDSKSDSVVVPVKDVNFTA